MTDRPQPSPLVATLARIIRAIEEREAAERAEDARRRARLRVIDGGRKGAVA